LALDATVNADKEVTSVIPSKTLNDPPAATFNKTVFTLGLPPHQAQQITPLPLPKQ